MEDANKVIQLNGVSLLGSKLRIMSTSRYNQTCRLARMDTNSDISAMKRNSDFGETRLSSESPTTVLLLDNMLSYEDLVEDHDYQEAIEDVKDECKKYGPLKRINLPRTGIHATRIFLEYHSIRDATNAFEGLKNKTFDGRSVTVRYIDEDNVLYNMLDV
eukprot:CAMPEP_0172499386 /NCGR_PEP_ID=MMETSP1066-20121228/126551_1 /TAXON_ID=671091 /ORGANISM="Coscinodiscus wailesii, Strain CCMP2513" /LENGTH=159 /DNA_ID=CAMNT_0013273111 /DNA_START=616 /DNA_END=1095 /DNA_ORIENTATION=+